MRELAAVYAGAQQTAGRTVPAGRCRASIREEPVGSTNQSARQRKPNRVRRKTEFTRGGWRRRARREGPVVDVTALFPALVVKSANGGSNGNEEGMLVAREGSVTRATGARSALSGQRSSHGQRTPLNRGGEEGRVARQKEGGVRGAQEGRGNLRVQPLAMQLMPATSSSGNGNKVVECPRRNAACRW